MSDIRTLMDSASPVDWEMAIRQPGVTGEDIDYLLGRMRTEVGGWRQARIYDEKQVPDKDAIFGRSYQRQPTFQETQNFEWSPIQRLVDPFVLMAHPAFEPHHLHDMMSIRYAKKPGEYGDKESPTAPAYRLSILTATTNPDDAFAESRKKLDDTGIHMMLDDGRDWIQDSRELPDLVDHPSFGPSHMGRLIELSRQDNLGDKDVRPFAELPNMEPFMKRHPEIPASYLSDWLTTMLKHQDKMPTSHLVEQIAQHPNLSDDDFQRLITSDHPRRDSLQHRQMSDSQLKAFLTDPRVQDPTQKMFDVWTLAHIGAIDAQGIISPENAEAAARSPRRAVRRAIARHPSCPDEVQRRLYRHEPEQLARSFAINPSVPADLITEIARNTMTGLMSGGDNPEAMDTFAALQSNDHLPASAVDQLISPEWISKNSSMAAYVREHVADNPKIKLTPVQLRRLVTDASSAPVEGALNRKEVTPEDIRASFTTKRKGMNAVRVHDKILRKFPQHLGADELQKWLEENPNEDKLEDHSEPALQNAFAHPAFPRDRLEKWLQGGSAKFRGYAMLNPQVPPEKLSELLMDPINHTPESTDTVKKVLALNPNVNPEHVAIVALHHQSGEARRAAIEHPVATEELLRIAGMSGNTIDQHAALNHPKLPADVVAHLANDPSTDMSVAEHALRHPNMSDELLKRLATERDENGYAVSPLHTSALEQYKQHHPDMDYRPDDGRTKVKFGVGKLRKIRDLIWEHDPMKGEAPPKVLPPGDWSAGRIENGNISAKKLQQVIDQTPEHQYNVSGTQWKGAQRHSDEPSQVTQFNITDDHVRQMKAAGVYGTFLNMMKTYENSDHPVRAGHTIGWVRWTGSPLVPALAKQPPPPDWRAKQHTSRAGIHIDEIQSDFGQNWVRMAKDQAHQMGYDPEEAERRAELEWPSAHQKVISGILFGGRHPNEMLGEAFMQSLRDQGFHETPVHIHDAATKAPLSGMRPGQPLPGHMQFTYKDLPKKLGMKPDTYGKLETQSNPHLEGKPSWSDKVRKSEVEHWLEDRGAGGDPLAHLGLAGLVEQRLQAVKSLGLSHPDPISLRQALVEYEDVDEAVLAVTGADPALLRSIVALTKAEPEPTPERPPGLIKPLTSSAEGVRDAVRRAFNTGHVQSVYLGGKHSAGSMLARDPQGGDTIFLKPGSGGQSPALGVQEEVASQARREAGFWHLAKLLGLEHDLPRAEVLVMDGHDWAALHFLDHAWKNFDDVKRAHPSLAIEALERLRRHGILHRWAVLDWIAGNPDRHGANLMLGPTGGVKLIDHGSAFAGPSFNPGADKNSFVPFYLRYRVPRWSKVPPAEKLGVMAQLDPQRDTDLRRWVTSIDVEQVSLVLRKDGLNADPPVARLRQLQHLAATVPPGQFHVAVDRLWAAV